MKFSNVIECPEYVKKFKLEKLGTFSYFLTVHTNKQRKEKVFITCSFTFLKEIDDILFELLYKDSGVYERFESNLERLSSDEEITYSYVK